MRRLNTIKWIWAKKPEPEITLFELYSWSTLIDDNFTVWIYDTNFYTINLHYLWDESLYGNVNINSSDFDWMFNREWPWFDAFKYYLTSQRWKAAVYDKWYAELTCTDWVETKVVKINCRNKNLVSQYKYAWSYWWFVIDWNVSWDRNYNYVNNQNMYTILYDRKPEWSWILINFKFNSSIQSTNLKAELHEQQWYHDPMIRELELTKISDNEISVKYDQDWSYRLVITEWEDWIAYLDIGMAED